MRKLSDADAIRSLQETVDTLSIAYEKADKDHRDAVALLRILVLRVRMNASLGITLSKLERQVIGRMIGEDLLCEDEKL